MPVIAFIFGQNTSVGQRRPWLGETHGGTTAALIADSIGEQLKAIAPKLKRFKVSRFTTMGGGVIRLQVIDEIERPAGK
jgi:hypothetical protein